MGMVLFPFVPFALGGVTSMTLASGLTDSAPVGVAIGAAGGVLASLAWWYSPIPHHNGGFGLPPARRQRWGFTTEPQAEVSPDGDD